jgi:hypothetical protein
MFAFPCFLIVNRGDPLSRGIFAFVDSQCNIHLQRFSFDPKAFALWVAAAGSGNPLSIGRKSDMSRTTPEARAAVQALMALPENAICADCKKRPTKWASSTLGVFICLECSGVHRSLGTHITFVRSCTLDGWTPNQVRVMRRVGNANGNAWWEARLPPDYVPPCFDRGQMESFIRAKYAEHRWAGPGLPPHVQSLPPAIPATNGRANPSMYEGRFAHNPQATQQQQIVFGRNPPAPKHMVQSSSVDITDFMKGMQKKETRPPNEPDSSFDLPDSPNAADSRPPTADDSSALDVASAFDFADAADSTAAPSTDPTSAFDFDFANAANSTAAPSTDPTSAFNFADAADSTAAPSTDPTSAFDFIKGEEAHPPPEKSRPPPNAPPTRVSGGSTAGDIMRQRQPAATPQKAKPKQSLFGKARPKGAAAFMRKPNDAPPAHEPPRGPSALDQMLAIVQTAGYRPESAPVMQVTPRRAPLGLSGPPLTSQTTEIEPQDIRQYRQQYPLAFPDPDFA